MEAARWCDGGSGVGEGWLRWVRAGLWLVPGLLVLGAVAALLWGGPRAAGSAASGSAAGVCAPLSGMEPVAVKIEGESGSIHEATGYAAPEGEVLVPLRGLVEHAAPVYWDEFGRTVSLLGPQDVLSVHFRGDRVETRAAVLNGEVIATRAVRCERQVYLPAELVSAVLHLEVVLHPAADLRLAPRGGPSSRPR